MSPLTLAKYGETFSVKKLCMGEQTFSGQIYGRIFYTWNNDQIRQGWMLIDERFQRLSQVSFPLIDPDQGY